VVLIYHKWFNVPYASGIFYTRSLALLKSVFGPSPRHPPPAYLTPIRVGAPIEPSTSSPDLVPSPLHTNLEDSRRFVALPLFAAFLSLESRGYSEHVERNVQFARDIAGWMNDDKRGGRWYEVLDLTRAKMIRSRSYSMSSCFAPEPELRLRPTSVRRMGLCYYVKRSMRLGKCIRVQQYTKGWQQRGLRSATGNRNSAGWRGGRRWSLS